MSRLRQMSKKKKIDMDFLENDDNELKFFSSIKGKAAKSENYKLLQEEAFNLRDGNMLDYMTGQNYKPNYKNQDSKIESNKKIIASKEVQAKLWRKRVKRLVYL